jgi:hypothetical protein
VGQRGLSLARAVFSGLVAVVIGVLILPGAALSADPPSFQVPADGVSCPFFGAAMASPTTTNDTIYFYEQYSAGGRPLYDDGSVCFATGQTATTAHEEVPYPNCVFSPPRSKSVSNSSAEVADFNDGRAILLCGVPDDDGAGHSHANTNTISFVRQDAACPVTVGAGAAGATSLQLTTSDSIEVDQTYTTYSGGQTTAIMTLCVGALPGSAVAPSADTNRQVSCEERSPFGTGLIQGAGISATYTDRDYLQECLIPDTAPPPAAGKSVDAAPVAGTVLVELPGKHKFTRLEAGQRIPLGTTIDATQGTVSLTSAKDKHGHAATGRFYDGAFRITQTPKLITNLTLAGPKPSCSASDLATAARRKPKKKSRSLWGNSSGSYRISGSDGSATERGTKWFVQDSCAGTLIRVARGSVTIVDFLHHDRTFVLKAPHSFQIHPGPGG